MKCRLCAKKSIRNKLESYKIILHSKQNYIRKLENDVKRIKKQITLWKKELGDKNETNKKTGKG